MYSISLAVSLMKILNSIRLVTDLWGTLLIFHFHLDIEPLIATLWTLPSSHFLTHLTVNPSNPHLCNLEERMLWEPRMKLDHKWVPTLYILVNKGFIITSPLQASGHLFCLTDFAGFRLSRLQWHPYSCTCRRLTNNIYLKSGEINEEKFLMSSFFRTQTCNFMYDLHSELNSKVIFYCWKVWLCVVHYSDPVRGNSST